MGPVKKGKVKYLFRVSKNVIITVKKQLVQVREERKLMSRLLVASRSRPDIILPNNIGTYKFSVVPISLFAADGTLYQTTDRSVITSELRKLQKVDEMNDEVEQYDYRTRRAMIFDGMAIVYRISIKKRKMMNCLQFADQFIDIIRRESYDVVEIRVVIDRYES